MYQLIDRLIHQPIHFFPIAACSYTTPHLPQNVCILKENIRHLHLIINLTTKPLYMTKNY